MIIDPDLRNEITRNLTVTLPEATIRDENLVNYMMHILNKIGSIEKQKKYCVQNSERFCTRKSEV